MSALKHLAFVDPSGVSSDSMTLAIAHEHRRNGGKGNRIVLDLNREVRPPFNPDQVVEEFGSDLRRYRVQTVTGGMAA